MALPQENNMHLSMVRRIELVVLYTFMAVVFLISGLILNLMQALIYITLYYVSRNLYRRINYYLIYSSWSQIVTLAEWWSNSSCNLYGEEETLKKFGKEHSVIIMNHKYEVDWLMCWLMCDKLKMLGNAKASAKKSLRHIPVIGWGWVFAEMIFLERNWEKDSLSFGQKLDNLLEYEHPWMLLLFCEGTRFTEEKHAASMEVARSKGVPELKHHLLPRTKGFNFAVRHLKEKTNAIYDVQLAFPNGSAMPTFSKMLLGHKFVGEMFVRRIPMSEIPTDSDEETSAWLFKLYREKDSIMEEYLKTNSFPGKCMKYERRIYPPLNTLFWSICVGIPSLYYLFQMFTSGNSWLLLAASTSVTIVLASMYMMVGATKTKKGSSYGKVTSANDAKENLTVLNNANGDCHEGELKTICSASNLNEITTKKKDCWESELQATSSASNLNEIDTKEEICVD